MTAPRFKTIVRLVIVFSITGVFLYLAFGKLDWQEAGRALQRVAWLPLLLALPLLMAEYSLRIYRWSWMLQRINADVTWRDCARPLVASYVINNLVPLRAGDVVRAVAFRRRLNSPAVRLLGTIAIERLLDLLVVLLIFGTVVVILPPVKMPAQWVEALQWVALLLCGALIALIVLLRPIDRWLGLLEQRTGGRGGVLTFTVARFRHLHDALELLGSFRRCLMLVLQTALIWLLEGCIFLLVAVSLQTELPALTAWFTMATGALGTAIPSSPGHLGTFDYFVIEAQRAYGSQRELAGVFAIIVHLLLWLPITALGGLYLLLSGGFRRQPVNGRT